MTPNRPRIRALRCMRCMQRCSAHAAHAGIADYLTGSAASRPIRACNAYAIPSSCMHAAAHRAAMQCRAQMQGVQERLLERHGDTPALHAGNPRKLGAHRALNPPLRLRAQQPLGGTLGTPKNAAGVEFALALRTRCARAAPPNAPQPLQNERCALGERGGAAALPARGATRCKRCAQRAAGEAQLLCWGARWKRLAAGA